MGDEELNFRESLLNTLAGAFSVNQQERSYSEDQLKIFETSEGFGVLLTNIILERNIPESLRQLASVLLRQYVDCHWSHNAGDKFKPPETSEQAKAVIRENLPKALQLPSSKIRSCVAYALSSIAHWDWPEEWPNFFELLIQAINSGDPNLIHGAVRVMTEFVKEVSDLQMPHVAPILLPNVLNIIQQSEAFTLRTRGRAVDIFNTIADLIALMKEVYKNSFRELLLPLLPTFVNCFGKELVTPDGSHSDWGVKMEVLKALQTLVKGYPKFMSNHITIILPPIWRIFTESVEYYVRSIVNSLDLHEDPVDEDGEVLSFENFIYSIFEFITALVEAPRFKKTVKEYLEDIMFHTLIYMQITEEQKDQWISDVNQFVENEDEESFSCSVRISAQYLLMKLCEKFNKTCAQSLVNAVAKIQQRGDMAKAQGDANWWKFHEVCLLSLGLIQPDILEMLQSNQLKFNADAVLIKLMVESCQIHDVPFLMGQALWCSSRYVSALSLDHLNTFIGASVAAVQDNQPPVMRIYGVKALYGFCDHLKETEKVGLLEPHLQSMANGLISFATHITESSLALTLETLNILLSVNNEFTANFVPNSDVIPLLNALFLKYGTDVHLNSVLGEIFGTLAPIPGCYKDLLEKTVPMLTSVTEAPVDKVPQALVPPTLDVLVEIIRHSARPIPDVLVTRSFRAVVQCIVRSEDYAIIQSGGECVRAFISCAMDQLLAWHDANGASGLEYVVKVVTHLLDPRVPQNSAVFVGRLINSLVIKAGVQLGDSLQLILRAVLSKLQQADALNVVQSLLMVFIQLIRYQLEMTLEFLSLVPGPTGRAALDYILTEWCSRQNVFYGSYERKASCDALCKILQHALNSGDKRFQEIMVAGDAIDTEKGIQTRSKSKAGAKEYTMIPVGIKIFKLIVNELASEIEKDELVEENDDDEDDEEGEWEDVDDENENFSPKEMTIQNVIEAMFAASSDYPGFDLGDDDDGDDDDPDVKDDTINETNMKLYLNNFIQELSKQSYFIDFLNYLNDTEKHCLVKAGFVRT